MPRKKKTPTAKTPIIVSNPLLQESTERYLTHSVSKHAETYYTIPEIAQFLGISILDLMPALVNKELPFDRNKGILFHSFLGYCEKIRTFPIETEWGNILREEGLSLIKNVFSADHITILLEHAKKELEYRTSNPNEHTIFDKDQDGELFVERQRFVYNTPLVHFLDYPLWGEIAETLFGTSEWIPSQLAIIQRPQKAKGMSPHRDAFWYFPIEDREHIRVFASINLTPPEEGDGGLYYIPGSHKLNEDGVLPCPLPNWESEGLVQVDASVHDVILHNNGVVHMSHPNTGTQTSYRLYIEMIAQTEKHRNRYQGVDMYEKNVQAKTSAKIDKLFS